MSKTNLVTIKGFLFFLVVLGYSKNHYYQVDAGETFVF